MRNVKRCSKFLAVALVLAAASACGSDGDDPGAAAEPTVVDQTTVETAAAATTLPPATTEAADDRLPEGVYHTSELSRDQLIASAVAAGFNEDEVAAYLDRDGTDRTLVIGLRLAGGGWSVLLGIDGASEEVGWRGTYEVVDPDTVVATDPDGSVTLHFEVSGDQLALELVDDQCECDQMIGHVLYESAPFTRDAATPASTGTTSSYTSTSFVVPFSVTLPAWLPSEPSAEEPNFVTWEAPAVDRAVRFIVPVNVYPPGGTGTTPAPDDYVAYLLGQSADGAELSDVTETKVDGRPATIVTATVADSLDGSLGCPQENMTAEDCFGLQPDLALRIAVIDAGDETLLVWVRDIRGTTVEYDSFDAMLASLRFDDQRQPTTVTTAQPTPTPIDGTWTTSFTRAELASSPLLYDQGEINDENWGTFTLTFEQGAFVITRTDPASTDYVEGSFHVDGDSLSLDLDSLDRFDVRWRLEGDTLILERDDDLGVGPTPLVIKPWTRQR